MDTIFYRLKKQSILLETGKGSRSEMKIVTQNQVQAAVDCPVACLLNVTERKKNLYEMFQHFQKRASS